MNYIEHIQKSLTLADGKALQGDNVDPTAWWNGIFIAMIKKS